MAAPLWVLIVVSHTIADPDLWGHIRFGADFLATYRLPARDIYSFTSDVAWINHEWLSEAAFAAAFTIAGAAGLNALKLGVIAALAWIGWRTARRAGASMRTSTALTSVLVFTSYTRTQVLRPQLLSVLLFALMLTLLERGGRKHRFIGIPLLFCVWANSHGAWIVGYAALCAWVAGDALDRRSPGGLLVGAGLLASAAAATALNPYGFGLWTFLRTTVGFSRSDITDWAPLVQLPRSIIVIDSILPVIAVVSAIAVRRRPEARHAAVIAALAIATWRVGRVDAFLQVAIALLMMPIIVEALRGISVRFVGGQRMSQRSAINGVAAALLAAAVLAVSAERLTRVAVEGPWVPDREAVRVLRGESRPIRLLTWFNWGEYAIWHLSPVGAQVSVDGRRETVYSERVLNDHWAFYRNEAAAWQYPDRIRADRIWLPRDLPVVASLRDHGWNVVFESDRSVVLSREPRQPLIASSRDLSPPLFPAE